MKINRLHFVLAAAVSAISALPALAQHQVENAGGQVDNRVGGELYGNNGDLSKFRPYQFRLLPSEERNAAIRSAALPSELELNQSSIGPLTPNGALDYIPRQSPLQRAMNLPEPQLYNRAYDLSLQPQTTNQQLLAQPGFAASELKPAQSTEKRPAVQISPLSIAPGVALPTGELPTGQLSGNVETLPGMTTRTLHPTIRHGTLLLKKQPTTQPTPPPAPKP
jgi:hypothetical protein